MTPWRYVCAGLLLVLLHTPATAQTSHQTNDAALLERLRAGDRVAFPITPTTADIRIDGVLSETIWHQALPITLPFETFPGDNTPAPFETTCRVLYDQDHLYFACEAFDPHPEQIRAYITDRDNVGEHDHVALIIDPFNDARRAFDFTINALGVQADGLRDSQGGFDETWDAIWDSAGRITEQGFVVEAAIPFKSLRFPGTEALQTWGMYLERWQPRSQRVHTMSIYWDRSNSCLLCQTNLLNGIEGIRPGRNVEVVPTVTSRRTDERETFPEGKLEAGTLDAELGLDARWSITPNLALNATLNPDFSQVEADVAQLDVNNRFALFFPEKRPFFLEGADFFDTPLDAVFTRTIADPSFGTKLTGKAGANAIGLIAARDEITNLLFPGSQRSSSSTLEEKATTVIGRYRRDIGASSTAGVIYTGREGQDYYNRVGGVDGFVQLAGPLTSRVQYLRSQTHYPDSTAAHHDQPSGRFNGDAFRVQLNYDTRNWDVSSFFQSFHPDFRADAGFMTQVGLRQFDLRGTRRVWGGPDRWYTRLLFTTGGGRREDFEGQRLDQFVFMALGFEGPLQTSLSINPDRFYSYFEGKDFTIDRLNTWFSIQPTGYLDFSVFGQFGEAIDFDNVREAGLVRLSPSLDLRLGPAVELGLDHTLQRLSTAGRSIFTANLSQVRAVYNFTTRLFVRTIVQFRHTRRNPDLYTDEVDRISKALFTQLLFSYKLNPQSVIFIGYSDNRLGETDMLYNQIPLTPSDRTVFLKLGYAWRP